MNLFILFSVLLLNNALAGSTVPDETTNCVQNATLSRECNTCLCNSNSNATLCKSTCDNSTVIITPVINDNNSNTTNLVCQPNDVKIELCNRCKCAANGIGWFCTRRACQPPQRHRRQVSASNCTAGSSWNDGCNTCSCSENGAAICTQRYCVESSEKRKSTQSERKHSVENSMEKGERRCTPGQHWKNKCNDCFCTETGIAACTLRGCLPNMRVGPQISVIQILRNQNHTNENQQNKNEEKKNSN